MAPSPLAMHEAISGSRIKPVTRPVAATDEVRHCTECGTRLSRYNTESDPLCFNHRTAVFRRRRFMY